MSHFWPSVQEVPIARRGRPCGLPGHSPTSAPLPRPCSHATRSRCARRWLAGVPRTVAWHGRGVAWARRGMRTAWRVGALGVGAAWCGRVRAASATCTLAATAASTPAMLRARQGTCTKRNRQPSCTRRQRPSGLGRRVRRTDRCPPSPCAFSWPCHLPAGGPCCGAAFGATVVLLDTLHGLAAAAPPPLALTAKSATFAASRPISRARRAPTARDRHTHGLTGTPRPADAADCPKRDTRGLTGAPCARRALQCQKCDIGGLEHGARPWAWRLRASFE